VDHRAWDLLDNKEIVVVFTDFNAINGLKHSALLDVSKWV